jgi:hypothetical protein
MTTVQFRCRRAEEGGVLRTNYVLIDFESVQPAELASLDSDQFKVMLFVGANQSKLPFELILAVQKFGARAEYVKISGNGPNALDFHIAFYIGQIASIDKNSYFHIISKDTGFDPLITHLRTKKIPASRVDDISDIPILKLARSTSTAKRVEIVVAKLKQFKDAKPRTMMTLRSTIGSLFQKQLTDGEVADILDALQSHGFVSATDERLAYPLVTADHSSGWTPQARTA